MKRVIASRSIFWLAVVVVLLASVSFGPTAYRKLQARYHLREGQKAYNARNYEAAEKHLLRAKELDNQLLEAHIELVRFYYSWHPYPVLARREIAIIPDLLKLDPSNRYALQVMAESWLVLEDRAQAKQWLRRWAAFYPDDPDPICQIGFLNWSSVYERRLEGKPIEPNSDEYARLLKLVDEGVDLLKVSIQRNPDYRDSYTRLALLYQERANLVENTDERKRWLREADLTALAATRLGTPPMGRGGGNKVALRELAAPSGRERQLSRLSADGNIPARACLTRVAADPPSRLLHGSSGGKARAGR